MTVNINASNAPTCGFPSRSSDAHVTEQHCELICKERFFLQVVRMKTDCAKVCLQSLHLTSHLRAHDCKQYVCKIPDCGELFREKDFLESHKRKHNGQYQCFGCRQMWFPSKEFGLAHVRELHPELTCEEPNYGIVCVSRTSLNKVRKWYL